MRDDSSQPIADDSYQRKYANIQIFLPKYNILFVPNQQKRLLQVWRTTPSDHLSKIAISDSPPK
jgi:hypothetical protein